jgi:hypothetical protein
MPLLTDQLHSELRDAFSDRLDRDLELRLVVCARATGPDRKGCPAVTPRGNSCRTSSRPRPSV